ncbi:MAG: phage head-tail connector protein [[Eubacterium] sulci]|nr:phage head-tail connector protein [[Eubacterium] sulci]
MYLDSIKALLGPLGYKHEELIHRIAYMTEQRLKVLISSEEVPYELSYIVVEVSVARFNRIGSEGLSSHNVEGEQMTWSNDDFKPYTKDIETYLKNKSNSTQGRVRFI